nr:hypothetical protein [Mycoplasma capricolum]
MAFGISSPGVVFGNDLGLIVGGINFTNFIGSDLRFGGVGDGW